MNKEKVKVFYRATSDGFVWSKEIRDEVSFLDFIEKPIIGFTAISTAGLLNFRAHNINGKWLNWIDKYNWNDWNRGVAGKKRNFIDGIQMELKDCPRYQVSYRAHSIGEKEWGQWIIGYDDKKNNFAGILGKPIDRLQIKIVEK